MSDKVTTLPALVPRACTSSDPRPIVAESPQSVLEGTISPRELLKKDAARVPFDPTKPYLKVGDELDPVLAFHLGRTHL
ncbi:MAG: hypothetical protein WA324_07565 [Bryobacteraceae bacterium]